MRSILAALILLVQFPVSAANLPRDFRFGVSTAAHQVEGNNSNSDWWQWEEIPGKIKNGQRSGIATDSWGHQDEDISNMKSLGVSVYRYSIEWAKVEPKEGVFDEKVLAQYSDQVDRLLRAGIEPMITLQHFTLPLWVKDHGGWDWDGIAGAFETYLTKVIPVFGKRVKYWITINEPMSMIAGGYMSDVFPPGVNNLSSIGTPMINMLRAHGRAYHRIHEILEKQNFTPMVGLAHNLIVLDPLHSYNLLEHYVTRRFSQIYNWAIPDALTTGEFKIFFPFMINAKADIPEAKNTQDFFGLNYYTRYRVKVNLFSKDKFEKVVTPGAPVNDLGWEIYPEGIARLLNQIQERFPQMPIWITENGIADADDHLRTKYIKEHLDQIADRIEAGVPVKGYCQWTLNDNFEWAEGFTAHFGFYSLDPKTLNRVPRQSAADFSEITRSVKMGLPIPRSREDQ